MVQGKILSNKTMYTHQTTKMGYKSMVFDEFDVKVCMRFYCLPRGMQIVNQYCKGEMRGTIRRERDKKI